MAGEGERRFSVHGGKLQSLSVFHSDLAVLELHRCSQLLSVVVNDSKLSAVTIAHCAKLHKIALKKRITGLGLLQFPGMDNEGAQPTSLPPVIADKDLAVLASSCPQLEEACFCGELALSNAAIKTFCENAPSLRTLFLKDTDTGGKTEKQLGGSVLITSPSLRTLRIARFLRGRRLVVQDCTLLNDLLVVEKHISSLELLNCPLVTKVVVRGAPYQRAQHAWRFLLPPPRARAPSVRVCV